MSWNRLQTVLSKSRSSGVSPLERNTQSRPIIMKLIRLNANGRVTRVMRRFEESAISIASCDREISCVLVRVRWPLINERIRMILPRCEKRKTEKKRKKMETPDREKRNAKLSLRFDVRATRFTWEI